MVNASFLNEKNRELKCLKLKGSKTFKLRQKMSKLPNNNNDDDDDDDDIGKSTSGLEARTDLSFQSKELSVFV